MYKRSRYSWERVLLAILMMVLVFLNTAIHAGETVYHSETDASDPQTQTAQKTQPPVVVMTGMPGGYGRVRTPLAFYGGYNQSYVNYMRRVIERSGRTQDLRPSVGESVPQSASIEGIKPLNQLPELPTGCEATSLTMALNYAGYTVDKMTIAGEYLPKENAGEHANPYTSFIGDPRSAGGYGCYAPALMICALRYGARAQDISGSAFDSILKRISAGQPVLMWATINMVPSGVGGYKYRRPDGVVENWKNNEHCLLMTGYDLEENTVMCADPLKGEIVKYDLSLFRTRWDEQGQQAMIVFEKQ